MDYKEKYEAVMLDIDTALLGTREENTKIVLENIKQRNSESEDERMRKFLIDILSHGSWRKDWPCSPVECIAWLEKQKDNTEGDFGRGYDCGYQACLNSHGAEWLEKQKEQKDFRKLYEDIAKSEWFKKAYVGKSLGEEDEQKEQKSAEWSEEDSDILRDAICATDILAKDFKKDNPHLAKTLRVAKEWLESLPERFTLQPKQEWSEFDADCLRRAIWYVENPAPSVIKDTNLVLWLKSLPLNLKKKNEDVKKLCSNEWSEEDVRNLYNIIYATYDTYKNNEEYKKNLTTWLKSLRPHWKPSEEQMEALMLAIEGKCPPTSYMSRRLEDLYEGLANNFNVECNLQINE